MTKRPIAVTIFSGIFLAVGVLSLAYHGGDFRMQGAFRWDWAWVSFVRLLAVIGAVFMFRGANWARWLLVAWLAFHVVLSVFHSAFQAMVHGLLFAVIAYFLLRSSSSSYFRRPRVEPPK